LRPASVQQIFRAIRIDDFRKTGLHERAGHLAGAVSAEIEENHGVVIAD
jgi:hypothetical protein